MRHSSNSKWPTKIFGYRNGFDSHCRLNKFRLSTGLEMPRSVTTPLGLVPGRLEPPKCSINKQYKEREGEGGVSSQK